jgi:hypothetical protein
MAQHKDSATKQTLNPPDKGGRPRKGRVQAAPKKSDERVSGQDSGQFTGEGNPALQKK